MSIKIKTETLVAIGTLVLGGAQMLLNNKKGEYAREKMKREMKQEIIQELTETVPEKE